MTSLPPPTPFTADTLIDFLRNSTSDDALRPVNDVREVGDGNINYVFLINDLVCVKQALPYIRIVKEAELPIERLRFEYEYLKLMKEIGNGQYVVNVHSYYAQHSCMIMECLSSHQILRQHLIHQQHLHSRTMTHLATHLAISLFETSDLAVPAMRKRQQLVRSFSGNAAMCHLTEEVIFTCPYRRNNPVFPNRYTTPQLDDMVASLLADAHLKVRVGELKQKFLCNAEALLHGDLHTGSVMVNEHETKVMDAEFAFMGPMAFDIGLLIGNLLLAYFSYTRNKNNGETPFQVTLRTGMAQLWSEFVDQFRARWNSSSGGGGGGYSLLSDDDHRRMAQEHFFKTLFCDTLGFAGCEMIRRVVGIAHVEDLDAINDVDVRAYAEFAVVLCARWMICHPPIDMDGLMSTMTSINQGHDFMYKASSLLIKQTRVLVAVVLAANDDDDDDIGERLTHMSIGYGGGGDVHKYVVSSSDNHVDGWHPLTYEHGLSSFTEKQLAQIIHRVRSDYNNAAAVTLVFIDDDASGSGRSVLPGMHIIHESFELCRNNNGFICPKRTNESSVGVLGVPPSVNEEYVFSMPEERVSCVSVIHAFQRARVPFILGDHV